MKISADPHSPFYSKMAVAHCSIFFNNQPVADCNEADDEKGYVDVLLKYSTGEYVRKRGDQFCYQRLHGEVLILWDELKYLNQAVAENPRIR